jgi:hypothetical protein
MSSRTRTYYIDRAYLWHYNASLMSEIGSMRDTAYIVHKAVPLGCDTFRWPKAVYDITTTVRYPIVPIATRWMMLLLGANLA